MERDREVGMDTEGVETKRDAEAGGLTSVEIVEREGGEKFIMDVVGSTANDVVTVENGKSVSSIVHSGVKVRCRQLPLSREAAIESRGLGTSCSQMPMGSALDGMKAFWGAILDSSAPSVSTLDSATDSQIDDVRTTGASVYVPDIEDARTKGPLEEVQEDDDDAKMSGGGGEGEGGASKRFRRHTIAY